MLNIQYIRGNPSWAWDLSTVVIKELQLTGELTSHGVTFSGEIRGGRIHSEHVYKLEYL